MKVHGSKNGMRPLLLAFIGSIAGCVGVLLGHAVPPPIAPDPAALSAVLDRTDAQPGDIVRLTLKYRLPEGASLRGRPKIGGLRGLSVIDQTVSPDQVHVRLFVDRLTSWTSDPLTLAYEDRDGTAKTLATDPVSLTVRPLIDEAAADATLRPIRDIIPTRGFWETYRKWAVGVAAVGLLLLGAFLWHRKRRGRSAAAETSEPPHVIARNAIAALEKNRVFEREKPKAFYFAVSEIMRRYLESIRHFPAAESTTEEIARKVHTEVDRKLLTLLRQADLVKFADTVPSPEKKQADVRTALAYIEETCPESGDPAVAAPHRQDVGGRP